MSAEGANEGRGEVYGWSRDAWGGDPGLTVSGSEAGAYLGAYIASGHDHDGDGTDDLVVTAPADSRVAANAGSAIVMLDPGALAGAVDVGDADVKFYTSYAGSYLALTPIGDADRDGLGDLAFSQLIDAEDGRGDSW